MTTIVQYRKMLGWTQSELARRAKLTNNTVRRAENSEPVSGGTATAIAEALSAALGQRILVSEIEGLNVTL